MKWIKDLLKILFATIVWMLVIEAGLRLAYPELVEDWDNAGLVYEHNDDYLVALLPNKEKIFQREKHNGGDVIVWRTNNDGFRGPDLRQTAPQKRIMVYGDSNIQARFSKLENTFVYRLQEELARLQDIDVEVINGGVIGAGPDQSLIRMQSEIKRYDIDLVILHIFADNDFGDLIRNRLFEIDNNGLLIRSSHLAVEDERLIQKRQKTSGFRKLKKSLVTYKLVRKLFMNAQHSLRNEKHSAPEPAPEKERKAQVSNFMQTSNEAYKIYVNRGAKEYSVFGDFYDVDVASLIETKSSSAKKALMEQILIHAKQYVESTGAKLLVTIQPSVSDLTENNSMLGQALLNSVLEDYDPKAQSNAIASICKKHNIDYVNLYATFEENNPETLYFYNNDHWNDKGQKLAAEFVAEKINNKY